jgi:hypothetical protein
MLGHLYSCIAIHLCIQFINKNRMTYQPKNNWLYNERLNDCFSPEEFQQLEEHYTFSGQNIIVYHLHCDAWGDFHFDFKFMGVSFSGKRKLDSVNKALWSEETRDFIEFEMCLELLSHDAMNDVFENHELYK